MSSVHTDEEIIQSMVSMLMDAWKNGGGEQVSESPTPPTGVSEGAQPPTGAYSQQGEPDMNVYSEQSPTPPTGVSEGAKRVPPTGAYSQQGEQGEPDMNVYSEQSPTGVSEGAKRVQDARGYWYKVIDGGVGQAQNERSDSEASTPQGEHSEWDGNPYKQSEPAPTPANTPNPQEGYQEKRHAYENINEWLERRKAGRASSSYNYDRREDMANDFSGYWDRETPDYSGVYEEIARMMKRQAERDRAERIYHEQEAGRQAKDETVYTQDATTAFGKPLSFARNKVYPEGQASLMDSFNGKSDYDCLEKFCTWLTMQIWKRLGSDWGKVRSLVVRGGQMIINGEWTHFDIDMGLVRMLPPASQASISEGLYALFFNWQYLKMMKNMACLSIDDMDIFTDYIVPALQSCGYRRVTPMKMFHVCKGLNIFELGGYTVTYPLESDEMVEAIRAMEHETVWSRSMSNLYKGWSEGVNGLGNWSWEKYKGYLNKDTGHPLRHVVGCVFGIAGVGVAQVPRAGTAIGKFIHDAVAEARRK